MDCSLPEFKSAPVLSDIARGSSQDIFSSRPRHTALWLTAVDYGISQRFGLILQRGVAGVAGYYGDSSCRLGKPAIVNLLKASHN